METRWIWEVKQLRGADVGGSTNEMEVLKRTEMADSHRRFALRIDVLPEDIDENEHVNNAVYLNWVQDAAVAHWRAIVPPEAQGNTVWVVLRHEIDYKRPALAGDQVIVETWVGEATGVRFERHTEIFRAADGQLLAVARTVWCPIDRDTKRPKRVDADVRARFSIGGRE